MKSQRVAPVAVLALVAVGVVGCEPAINQGPLAIRIADGHLEFAVCEALDVKSAFAAWREASGEWETFIDARGQATTRVGTIFDMSFDGELAPAGSEPPIAVVDEFNLLIEGDDRNIHGLWSDLQVNPLGVAWRHPDGSETAEPCE